MEVDNTNRNFKGQQKNEVVLCFTRRHWIVLAGYLAGFVSVTGAVIVFFILFPQSMLTELLGQGTYRTLLLVAIAALTYFLHAFFLRFLNYYLQIVIVTNFRILDLDQTLYFRHNRDSIDLPEIQDTVIVRSGLLKTLLNYGDIIITLSATTTSKLLHFIPNPEYYFRKINKTKREYITGRRAEKTIQQPLQDKGSLTPRKQEVSKQETPMEAQLHDAYERPSVQDTDA